MLHVKKDSKKCYIAYLPVNPSFLHGEVLAVFSHLRIGEPETALSARRSETPRQREMEEAACWEEAYWPSLPACAVGASWVQALR